MSLSIPSLVGMGSGWLACSDEWPLARRLLCIYRAGHCVARRVLLPNVSAISSSCVSMLLLFPCGFGLVFRTLLGYKDTGCARGSKRRGMHSFVGQLLELHLYLSKKAVSIRRQCMIDLFGEARGDQNPNKKKYICKIWVFCPTTLSVK